MVTMVAMVLPTLGKNESHSLTHHRLFSGPSTFPAARGLTEYPYDFLPDPV
jgi:hypothetical protein